MDIELKNFKHVPSRSRATECYSATLYVDGKKAVYLDNDGSGGSTKVDPAKGQTYAIVKRLEDYAKQQPGYTNFEDFIGELFIQAQAISSAKKGLSKHIMIFDPSQDKRSVLQFPQSFKPSQMDKKSREMLHRKYPGCVILNDLDINQAAEYFTHIGYPDDLMEVYNRQKDRKVA